MITAPRAGGGLASIKGEAKPLPEPVVRPRTGAGRRVGAMLPTDLYVRFKAFVAGHGVTGEQAIVDAIERLVASDP